MPFKPCLRSLVVAALCLVHSSAWAETIKVYAAGAVKSAVSKLIPAFETRTGHKVDVSYDTVGALRDRLLKGETADIAILSEQAIAAVAKVTPSLGEATIGKTGVGIGVPAGAPKPPMATTQEFVAAIRAASSVGMADPARGATAGTHFRNVLVKLGLADELAGKIKVFPTGVDAIAAVGRGEIAFGSSQGTEIVGREGVTFAGFLPDDIQLWTIYRTARFGSSAAAKEFEAMVGGAQGKDAFAAIGFIP